MSIDLLTQCLSSSFTSQLDGESIRIILVFAVIAVIIMTFRTVTEYNQRMERLENENRALKEALSKQLTQIDVEMRCRAYAQEHWDRMQAIIKLTAQQCANQHPEISKAFLGLAYNIQESMAETERSFDPLHESNFKK